MHLFLSFLQGYVRICIQGFGVTRFVNICNKRGYRVWDLEQKEECYEFNILICDFKKIYDIVRKTKVKVNADCLFSLPGCLIVNALCWALLVALLRCYTSVNLYGQFKLMVM